MIEYLLTSYLVRLVCFSLASFFLINFSLVLVVWLVAPAAIRFADRLKPRIAARFAVALYLLPSGAALFAAVGLSTPSYLWLEPKGTHEQVSLACWVLALLCVLGLGLSTVRGFRILLMAMRYERDCRRDGKEISSSDGHCPLLVVDSDSPLLAVAGAIRPRIVISSKVLRELSPQQLDAALGHERTHLASRDNQKHLLMLLAPDFVPFCRGLKKVEQAWMKFSEWAADDQAVAGDSLRSVSLASALVRVAKIGLPSRPPGIATCFAADDTGLSARVDRLLRDKPAEDRPETMLSALVVWGAIVVGIFAATIVQPSTWHSVHRILEHLAR